VVRLALDVFHGQDCCRSAELFRLTNSGDNRLLWIDKALILDGCTQRGDELINLSVADVAENSFNQLAHVGRFDNEIF
jgi:hypothetical protein